MARPEPERSKDHLTSKFHSFVVRQSFGLLDLSPIICSLHYYTKPQPKQSEKAVLFQFSRQERCVRNLPFASVGFKRSPVLAGKIGTYTAGLCTMQYLSHTCPFLAVPLFRQVGIKDLS